MQQLILCSASIREVYLALLLTSQHTSGSGWWARACAGKDVPICIVSSHSAAFDAAFTPGASSRSVIQCALTEDIPDDPATRKFHRYSSKVENALAGWDTEHEAWHIFYYTQNTGSCFHCMTLLVAPHASPVDTDVKPYEGAVAHEVKPLVSQMQDVYVPEPVLQPYPASEEVQEDWVEECSDLFEWTGLACLGSQRYALIVCCPCPCRDQWPFDTDYSRTIDATHISLRTRRQAPLACLQSRVFAGTDCCPPSSLNV